MWTQLHFKVQRKAHVAQIMLGYERIYVVYETQG
jgi:hypothetical protein